MRTFALKGIKMKLSERINILVQLGEQLSQPDEYLDALINRSYHKNNWFTAENYRFALDSIRTEMLARTALENWVAKYNLSDTPTNQTVGMVLAGNIPLVGFHDVLCSFIAGYRSQIKLSDKDRFVLPYLVQLMEKTDERVQAYFEFVERLSGFNRVIATGSDNTARYFEQYFGKYPNIIRKNRNAVGVLTGNETPEELHQIGKDIFRYFGLGCRNVSKIYTPKDYDFQPLMESLHEYRDIIQHNKYKNNFDYNFTLLILNSKQYFSNGCILVHEDNALTSRIASLHYETYDGEKDLLEKIEKQRENIQCVVSSNPIPNWQTFPFGQAQAPALDDYADGIDTLGWLIS